MQNLTGSSDFCSIPSDKASGSLSSVRIESGRPDTLSFPLSKVAAQILSIISTKGGEGKSTQGAYLAGFTADAGLKTLLIDGDYSQPTSCSIYHLDYEAPCGLYELLTQTVDLNSPDKIISRTCIPNLDVIVSNDPDERLPGEILHIADGRMRLRNVLQHPLFRQYDVIIIDSKGAAGVMTEIVVLAADSVVGVIKPILPDVREFLRGTVRLVNRLLPLRMYGITIPDIHILINHFENTVLDRQTLRELTGIVEQKKYTGSADISISMLNTTIEKLEVYKRGHATGQPVHRLEYTTDRKSLPAAETIHHLACELFPQWKALFDDVLRRRPGVSDSPDAVSGANEGESGVAEAVCVGCGCTDNNACVNEFREPCHWLKVNRQTGLGVCSSCESFLGHPLTDDAE
ncbi:ParA family protein [Salmonella enterica subsp. enterica serovar Infantis]|uniref:ParA family protein n=2 Tax=Salmonella enterica TaxID=28901 RepID=A0A750IPG4_SALER|nr:ParA family protein [Salmonella enterica subsp. enterica serovar Oranienburg]EHA8877899.1 ParA family protein [Salmonella enterica subsp. enterica serovar Infantis]HAF6298503.1 ParA family protein [Salmonella enterica]HCA3587594.1 ParA family protein [Salmonella enterica subsp. enterica serovar Java]EDV9207005.1 ParA family protein [Salmonella enterica subsp. enterica serovar Oranienburg]